MVKKASDNHFFFSIFKSNADAVTEKKSYEPFELVIFWLALVFSVTFSYRHLEHHASKYCKIQDVENRSGLEFLRLTTVLKTF